jgi:peroxiredoxin Q/BCP
MKIGDSVPNFDRPNQDGVAVSQSSVGKAVVYFYPKAFTPGCTGESCDFRDRWEEFADAGYTILGVSPDPVERLAEFRLEYELPFDLLSDEDHTMAEAFDAWGVKKNYGKEYEGLIRSTVVIENGVVTDAWHNVKATGHAERVAKQVLT